VRSHLPTAVAFTIAVALVPVGTFAASPAASGRAQASPAPPSPTVAGAAGSPAADAAARVEGVPAMGSVFLIIGENTQRSLITPDHAPYLTGTIQPTAAWVNDYYALADGSLANYIGLTSGQYLPCHAANAEPADCHQKVDNVFSQLDRAGLPWQEWMESATNACDYRDSGALWAKNLFVTHHDPAVYYDRVQGGIYDKATAPSAECLANVLSTGTTGPNDTSALEAALAAGDIGRLVLIIPNACEQGHDPCGRHDRIRQFDDFLARIVPQIQASPAYGPDSVIMITWDEGGQPPLKDRFNIQLAVVGPRVKPGTYDGTVHFDHYSLLRTVEDGLGLPRLAGAGKSPVLGHIWR